jgi:hypothetical protein
MVRCDAPQRGNLLDAHLWRRRVPAVEGSVNCLAHAALGMGCRVLLVPGTIDSRRVSPTDYSRDGFG